MQNTGMGMNGMPMNPMMMNPMMGMMGGDGMNMFAQGMPGMGMGMGMPGMGMPGGPQGMPGMLSPGSMGPGSGGPSGQEGGPVGDGKFYKTKICHKFMEGKCNYGPTCKYAHGEGDLRVPGTMPRPAGSGKIMTPHGPPSGGMGGGMQAMGGMGGMQGMGGGMPGMGGGMQQKPPGAAGGVNKDAHFRTRLCEQFMKEGSCRYGQTCTFAHGAQELRNNQPRQAPRPGGQGMMPGAGGNAQKRPLDGSGPGDNKRPRTEVVVPPESEQLPDEGSGADLDTLKQRFLALQQEANRFARDTGHSVALFTVGGVLCDGDDETDAGADHNLLAIKSRDGGVLPHTKACVLKYGTGGVAKHLVGRPEIVKFVTARCTKVLGEMHARQQDAIGM